MSCAALSWLTISLGLSVLRADGRALGCILDPSTWSPPGLLAGTSDCSTSDGSTPEFPSFFSSTFLLYAFRTVVFFFRENKNLPFLFYDCSWSLVHNNQSLLSNMLEDFLKNTFPIIPGDLGKERKATWSLRSDGPLDPASSQGNYGYSVTSRLTVDGQVPVGASLPS